MKKNLKHRVLAIFLSACLLLGDLGVPLMAQAEEDQDEIVIGEEDQGLAAYDIRYTGVTPISVYSDATPTKSFVVNNRNINYSIMYMDIICTVTDTSIATIQEGELDTSHPTQRLFRVVPKKVGETSFKVEYIHPESKELILLKESTIKVKDPIHVNSVVLTPSEITMKPEETSKIYFQIRPEGVTDYLQSGVSLTDENVAEIIYYDPLSNNPFYSDETGSYLLVKALKPGESTLSASVTVTSSGSNKGEIRAGYCTITVTTPVTGVSLTPKTVILEKGQTKKLTTTVSPSTATDKSVTYSSSKPSVATVATDGTITAIAEGSATIYVTTNDGDFMDSVSVTVTEPVTDIKVSSVSVSPQTATMRIGETKVLTATLNPGNATNKNVSWTSTNPTVASVTSGSKALTNTITAHKAGTATITATTEDGNYSDSCTITVSETQGNVYVTSVSVNPTEMTLKKGATGKVNVSVLPENATNKNVSFVSTKSAVATVDESGVVTAIAKGEAIILVSTEDGNKTATCVVTVTEDSETVPVSGVSLDVKTLSLNKGDTRKLTAKVLPENANNKNVSFKSSKSEVATVSEDGTVTAIAKGDTVITVTTEDGQFTDTCAVVVTDTDTDKIESISLTPKSVSLNIGETKALTVTVSPNTANADSCIFRSSAEDIATVSDSGVVTGVKEGTAIITVTTSDGSLSDSSTVTVVKNSDPDDPDDPIDPDEPRPDPKDDPEVDDGMETYDDLIDATESRDIYLVKGQKIAVLSPAISTANKKVLSVGKPKNGYITLSAKKTGNTTISMPGKDGSTLTHNVYIETPAFAEKTVKLSVNEKRDFAVLVGANTDKYSIFYGTSDPDIAYVAQGKLYAISKGTATISAYINGHKYNCKVVVSDQASPKSLDSIETISLQPLTTINLKYKTGFKSKGSIWNVSNNKVAVVKKDKLTAVGVGSTIVTGTDSFGQTKSFKVVVKNPAVQTIHVNAGSSKNIKISRLNNKKATWTVKDMTIASVENGKVKGLTPGLTMVTCTYENFTFNVMISVDQPAFVTDNKLSQNGKKYNLVVSVGEEYYIKSNSINQVVLFTSNKPEIVRVNNYGRVIAVSPGKAKLTTKINGKSVTINVIVAASSTQN